MPSLEVLYEDNHLIAIAKPPGLPTMGVGEGDQSAVTLVKDYLKRKYHKPGNVYLGVVSRLDRMVTGVLLFARTSKGASRLSQQFRERSTQKRYRAIVAGDGQLAPGTLTDWMVKDEKKHRMITARRGGAGAQKAELIIESLQPAKVGWVVDIHLLTGRKHQIRVQLAARRLPIAGDRKYGSKIAFPHGIALHASFLQIVHPITREPLNLEAPLPKYWRKFL